MTISFDELLLPWSIKNSGFNESRFSFCFPLAVISLLTVEENKAQFIRIFTQKSDMLALKIMTMITKILSTITAHMYWLHWIAGDRWIRCSFLQTCNTFSQHVCFVRLFCACVSYKLQNDGVRLCVCVFICCLLSVDLWSLRSASSLPTMPGSFSKTIPLQSQRLSGVHQTSVRACCRATDHRQTDGF